MRSGLGDGPMGTAVCTASQPSVGTLVHFGLAFFAASTTIKRWKPLRTLVGRPKRLVGFCVFHLRGSWAGERERERNKQTNIAEKHKDERPKTKERKKETEKDERDR